MGTSHHDDTGLSPEERARIVRLNGKLEALEPERLVSRHNTIRQRRLDTIRAEPRALGSPTMHEMLAEEAMIRTVLLKKGARVIHDRDGFARLEGQDSEAQ